MISLNGSIEKDHIIVGFILVIMADVRIISMHGIFGVFDLDLWQSYLLTIFAYLVIINAINLIDGLDGLAGLISSWLLLL